MCTHDVIFPGGIENWVNLSHKCDQKSINQLSMKIKFRILNAHLISFVSSPFVVLEALRKIFIWSLICELLKALKFWHLSCDSIFRQSYNHANTKAIFHPMTHLYLQFLRGGIEVSSHQPLRSLILSGMLFRENEM